jgi:hypothetical protein
MKTREAARQDLIQSLRLKGEELIPESERQSSFRYAWTQGPSPILMDQTCVLPFWRDSSVEILAFVSIWLLTIALLWSLRAMLL